MSLRILITNHHLETYAGSELNAFDLACEFRSRGYEVEVATYFYGEPLRAHFEAEGFRVTDVMEGQLADPRFDLVWAHHAPLLAHCLGTLGVTAPHIVSASLSPFEPLETPPEFARQLSLCLCNSRETAEQLTGLGLLPSDNVEVFLNSVRPEYFEAFDANRVDRLRRLAIISNHVPEEVEALVSDLESRGVEVEMFGAGHHLDLITPQILEPFDAVLTIGRTVQYGLAQGIPVYCYDRFGGPGWITPDNQDHAEFYNFSGRCCRRRLEPQALRAELLEGFSGAFAARRLLHDRARARYSLKANVAGVLDRLRDRPALRVEDLEGLAFATRQANYYATALRSRRHAESLQARCGCLELQVQGLVETLDHERQSLAQRPQQNEHDLAHLLGSVPRRVIGLLRRLRHLRRHA